MRKAEGGHKRPTLAKVGSKQVSDSILENTKASTDADRSYWRINVNKDRHSSIHME